MSAIVESVLVSRDALPVCLSPSQENPYRLVSVWDMLRVYACNFLRVAGHLQGCAADVRIITAPERPADSAILARFEDALETINFDCADLGLEHTPDFVARFKFVRDRGAPTYGDIGEHARNIFTIYQSELRKRVFVYINGGRKDYFNSPFYPDSITATFPTCAQDIVDAGNCYALEQDTACVMHLMRVLEIGLVRIADEFGVDTGRDTWHIMIEQIESRIKELSPKDGTGWRERKESYAHVCVEFTHFKNAWRNHAMHARGRYNGPEAKQILDHTMSFMEKLSALIGQPEAL